ncbi:hypothetical protein CRG98_011779 [Punica granatum]|uniref:Uncharacterized protein n=1 Tax=Punica granatum TaxID=22663 RepID=A0A2I0KJ40_PUNGR|nr:hypothetical protein CRG98_011779 [Punica granatum]
MRCKKHPVDHSSSVGVCATCLRERLFALIAAQASAQPPSNPPPPLAFPRSVSPYVGPGCLPPIDKKKKHHRRLSVLSQLFRSRSEKLGSDPDPGVPASPHRDSSRTSTSSPSWFSFIPGRRRGPSRLSSVGESVAASEKKSSWVSDRGMSPARGAHADGDFDDPSPSGSGYSSESSQGWRKTPAPGATTARRSRPVYPRNMSGLAFCLSPLVRASPGRQWKQQKGGGGGMQQEIGYSGEIRASSARPHISTAASFCANRSRKLADFGRTNHNH